MPLPYLKLHGIVFLFAATAFLGHVISLSAPAVVIWRTALAAIGAAVVVVVLTGGLLATGAYLTGVRRGWAKSELANTRRDLARLEKSRRVE